MCTLDKLDDIVNEYNNTYHRTIKMIHILILKKKLMINIVNLKFAAKGYTPDWSEEVL